MQVQQDAWIGKAIGDGNHYLLEALIGSDGISKVYRALLQHLSPNDELVYRRVKFLAVDFAHHPYIGEYFQRQMQTYLGLQDRRSVQLFDYGVVSIAGADKQLKTLPFVVLEWLEIPTLERILQKQDPLDPLRVLALGSEIAAGLQAIHHLSDPSGYPLGWIYRELRPSQVFVSSDPAGQETIKLADFTLSKFLESLAVTTDLGSPSWRYLGDAVAYLAPEIWQDTLPVDGRADVYSLGCLLYRMLSGSNPFGLDPTASASIWMMAHLNQLPQPFAPELQIPPAIEHLVLRCLAKNPGDRFPGMGTVEAALRNCQADLEDPRPTYSSPTLPPQGISLPPDWEITPDQPLCAPAAIPPQRLAIPPAHRRLLLWLALPLLVGVGGYGAGRILSRPAPRILAPLPTPLVVPRRATSPTPNISLVATSPALLATPAPIRTFVSLPLSPQPTPPAPIRTPANSSPPAATAPSPQPTVEPLPTPVDQAIAQLLAPSPSSQLWQGEDIWVPDLSRGRVLRVSPTGQTQVAAAGLSSPSSVVPQLGSLLVTELDPGRLLRIDPDGRRVVLAQDLGFPSSLLVGNDAIYVADRHGHGGRLLRIGSDGGVVTLATQLGQPEGLALAAEDVLVTDRRGGRLLRIRPTGAVEVIASGLGSPVAVLPRAEDWLVLEEEGRSLLRVHSSGQVSILSYDLEGSPHALMARGDEVLSADLEGNVTKVEISQ